MIAKIRRVLALIKVVKHVSYFFYCCSGNLEIITVQSVRSMSKSKAEKGSASISASLSEADLVEVQTNKDVVSTLR